MAQLILTSKSGRFVSFSRFLGLFCMVATFSVADAIAQVSRSEAIVRVAEPGQLADTVMVWGDVTMPGTYLVPRGTRLMELVSYAKGPRGFSSVETQLDWSKIRVIIVLNPTDGRPVQRIDMRYNEPLDPFIRDSRIRNMDVIAFEVKRKPIFADYVRVAGPIISIALSSVVLIRTWK